MVKSRENLVSGEINKEESSNESVIHWADTAAVSVMKRKRETYVVAAGVAPSGSVTFGHLREVISAEIVARAIINRGGKVKLIYSWDDYDVFRKVPKNMPNKEELKNHLRKAVIDIPDPFGKSSNYAAGFEQGLEAVLPRLGIMPNYRYQAKQYRDCKYSEGIKKALSQRKEVIEILNEHREKPLSSDYWPITIYSDIDGTDLTKVLSWDGDKMITYLDVDNKRKTIDLTLSGAVKLLWRIDWPMRWAYEGVDFEPAGKDHHTAGGSFDTAEPISRIVYNNEPPVTFSYGDVGIKGGTGRISSSSGNVVTIEEVLSVYQPEVVRFLFAGTKPNAEFDVSFDLDVIKIYEDYDRLEREYFENGNKTLAASRIYELSQIETVPESLPAQISFRHICNLIQIRDGNIVETISMLEKKYGLTMDEHRRISQRAFGAAQWLKKYAPDSMRFRLRQPTDEVLVFEDSEKAALRKLFEELNRLSHHDGKTLSDRIYEIAREEGLDAVCFFKVIYRVLIGSERGPRLADFIILTGSDRIADLLRPYT